MQTNLRIWLWNVAVVAALLALAWWGHASRWQLPSFGTLVYGDNTADKEKPKRTSPPSSTDPNKFPPIEFESAENVKQAGIVTEGVVQRDLDLVVQVNATVGYDQTKVAQVSSRVSGFVYKVKTAQGQLVREGEVLAIIDSPEVGQARTEFLQDFSAHHFAVKRHERLQGLATMGAASEVSLREAELAMLETRVRRFNTQQKLLNLGLSVNLAGMENETPDGLARRIQVLGFSNGLLDQIQPPPKTANLIPLFAPSPGIVTQFDLVAGKRITTERSEIEIADVRTMWIRLSVRKEDAGRLALGQIINYMSAAGGQGPVEGRLTWISTSVDERTRTVQARAAVSNPSLASAKSVHEGPWLLRANEYGAAQVKVGTIANAILVPAKAVQRLDDISLVFVLRPDGKSFEPRKVEVGESRDGWVEVRSNVSAGERVATINSFVLKSELLKDRLEAP